ncbi:MAG TPA: hypothetical protein VFU79_09330 [Nitrososphaeraceae archaeon]|nr:hypothetical protein [Nitrososphaeraceae archaeon]
MQKLFVVGLFWIAVLITLIIFNMNFNSNAMAIESNYMQEGNNFYNNYHENGGYMQEGNNDIGKLIVKVKIYLQNLERTGFLRISSLLNGEEVIKDIELSEIDRYQQTVTVDLKVDKKNDIVEASSNDEYHVCAYHVKDLIYEYDSFTNFDCNEGDVLSVDSPNYISLFKPSSQVYLKSKNFHNFALNSVAEFDYNDYYSYNGYDTKYNDDRVIIQINSPLIDRIDTKKLKVMVMIKGQIQSEVIDDVQYELENSGGNTISRTFIFDRNTDIGLIHIGDKFLACVASDDLRPPEGQECEKRILKKFGEPNVLYAR